MNTKKLLIIIIIVSLFWSLIIKVPISTAIANEKLIHEPIFSELIPHDSIVITNDGNFTDYGFPGYGNESHPYIIEGYSIVNTNYSGISIEGTTKHFIIRDCYIDVENMGIIIDSVATGTATIDNNFCIFNVFDSSIRLINSNNSTVINNRCIGSNSGILIWSCNNSSVTNNSCTSYNIGIYLRESDFSITSDNHCYSSNIGIYLQDTSYSNFTYNLLERNDGPGIWIDSYSSSSSNNKIYYNDFIDNYPGYNQAWDDGSNNVWYNTTTNEGNYWSDYDGVGAYEIGGPAGSIDPYPLSESKIPEFSFSNSIIYLVIITLAVVPFLLVKKRRNDN